MVCCYCLQAHETVSNRPRLWSSQTNVRHHHDAHAPLITMNSTEEITSYKTAQDFYLSPTFSKRSTLSYDYPEKSAKKEKKWFLGSLFRRKKKEESESSSEEEQKRGFLGRRRKKGESKRRKPKTVGGFDHIVLPHKPQQNFNGYHHHEDTGILSDPSGGFSNYIGRSLPLSSSNQKATSIGSGDSISKKKVKELVKARAAARRTNLGHDSSSDEDSSLRSNSSLKVRSDESLANHSKRSRAARTERYLKRHSKDGENPHNYLRLSKSDIDRSPSRSPLPSLKSPQINTIPPNHGVHKYLVSNSTSNPSYKPPQSMNDYNNSKRSTSYDANIHKDKENGVIHVNFPILRPQVCTRQPPQPPPRDPNRTVHAHYFENGRPTTVHFEPRSKSFNYSQLRSGSRSTSEVHIPNQVPQAVRPASTTPEPKYVSRSRSERHTVDGYNYLADKKPRSRKPIVIQSNKVEPRKEFPTQKALDFWKQIEESVNKQQKIAPQMFTSHTHVQSQVFLPPRTPSPFKPVSPTVNEVNHRLVESLSRVPKDDPLRKSANLEEALDELEAIYNSLRLGDENLLERAEQRENELVQRAEDLKKRGDSPKKRRIGKRGRIPDTKEDDMYNRKLVKEKSATISDPQAALSKMSYLLGSPMSQAYDSEGEMRKIMKPTKEPDVTFDDLGYRSVKRANASPKTVDLQPPFGIPLGPVSPAPPSDYLHAIPGVIYSHIPKKLPDVVKDDLAFRNLRKDSNKEPVLPAYPKKLDLNYLKKRRAVRSLSANIGNILGKDIKDSDEEGKSRTLTDIADAMEIARRVLREKGKDITETRKAFMSDSEVKRANGDAFKESRLKFLSDLSAETKASNNSSLDDLLNALAEEAKVTTERITQELKELENKRTSPEPLKPCQKLLKAVIDSNHLVDLEEVRELRVHSLPAESANIVQSCFKDSSEECHKVEIEHDYETIDSDDGKIDVEKMEEEVQREEMKKGQSPFREHRDELIASFQELNDVKTSKKTDSIYDNLEGKYSKKRSRLPIRWLRPVSCPDEAAMSETSKETRASGIARYKEERRKQLAEQFANAAASSSGSEGPRTTRASRLRAQAQEKNLNSPKTEKITSPLSDSPATKPTIERDKSSKRKSNLNRSLTSEVAPPNSLYDDPKTARRRRRFFPPEVLDQAPRPSATNTASPTTSTSLPSPLLFTAPTSPNVAIPTSPCSITHSSTVSRVAPRRSELSIHMENARKSVTTSESHKYKPFAVRKSQISSPKTSPSGMTRHHSYSDREKTTTGAVKRPSPSSVSDTETNRNIARRMEELTAFTRETLARVERLANRTRESPKNLTKGERFITRPSSILKRKSKEEKEAVVVVNEAPSAAHAVPVSILKRKGAQDDKTEAHSTHTPPVTFSPSVVEPASSKKKQGILKKRRSLDESTVMRHRSCSPDVANKASDSRSILKSQRRSSLEELRRTQSPEVHIHGILKRKPSKHEDDDVSLNSPHGILKRRSGASSAGSTSSTPHVSITTAVILAAAGGAEMILEPEVSQDSVKPILKKKSFSDEYSYSETTSSDGPKPILKKKSSTDTDEGEDSKPMRPILKLPKAGAREVLDTGQEGRYSRFSSGEDGGEMRPILKSGSLRADSPRPRLSFCGDAAPEVDNTEERRRRSSRRSYTICSDFNVQSNAITRDKEEDRDLRKARPLSVLELVRSFEKQLITEGESGGADESTGAIPKKSGQKRNNERYRTQPVTSDELQESRNLLRQEDPPIRPSNLTYHTFASLTDSSRSLDFASSLEDGAGLIYFLHSSTAAGFDASPEGSTCQKTSSDSAFQSLGDGLELEEPQDETEDLNINIHQSEMSSLASQMRSLAEEAKKKRMEKDIALVERKGILKPAQSETATPRRSQSFASPRSLLKGGPRHESAFRRVKPEKNEMCADKDDEGISSNESGSESDTEEVKIAKLKIKSGGADETTSEGESSGGREVKSIFKKESKLNLNFKLQLEGCLAKSKSSSFLRPVVKSCEAAAGSLEDQKELEEVEEPYKSGSGLRRSHTHTAGAMPRSIADLRAKLQESGEKEWMKRVALNNNSFDELKSLKEKNRYNDELSEKSLLAAKKDELDAASQQWKSRVEKSDAEKFSVAGKIGEKAKEAPPTINLPSTDNIKRTPQAKRYKGKEDASSTPSSPEKNIHFDLSRSKSALSPIAPNQPSDTLFAEDKSQNRIVPITKPDDFTFTAFFESVQRSEITNERADINLEDFDALDRQPLLSFKKNVQVPRRKGTSRNPIKALVDRTDISSQYTEVITGVAEREKRRLIIEKLSQNSNKSLDALAGLASNEDFKRVALKKGTGPTTLLPWKGLMLLQIKGRRHVQTRLVQPAASSINEGDCYLLVTSTALYNYTGTFSNVIERSRASDLANHIEKTGDLGCKVSKVINVSTSDVVQRQLQDFWKLLGVDEIPVTAKTGHVNEDEIYEANILQANMIYTLERQELVPNDIYWGAIPKYEMLKETAVIVFDFGSEMYVWSGKNAALEKKKMALKLAKEMWEDGYNYSDCRVNPLSVAEALGEREVKEIPLQADKRPSWALFAKITQHRETILFREKFLDWPDFSRVIRAKGGKDEGLKRGKGSIEIRPCNVDEMLKDKCQNPNLLVQNTHLGRGDTYFDEETRRLFSYDTEEIKAWRITENTHEELGEKSKGQFYDEDSYIYSWRFRQTVKGRELDGNPSKHLQVGRDMCVFFCWHGNYSSINEKCTAAFLTVELDKENAPQIRVTQGFEPAAFLRLFNGSMVIHHGKRGEDRQNGPKLFIVRGELEEEAYLMEVPLEIASLRSRTSFLLVDVDKAKVIIWHGCKSSEQKRKVTNDLLGKILEKRPEELFAMESGDEVEVEEIEEGEEGEFLDLLGSDRGNYHSLLKSKVDFDFTPRMYQMSSATGNFIAEEVLCPHRSQHSSPYAFVQSVLYKTRQPGLVLFDNRHELWLWQGWWPEKDEESELSVDQTGSGAIRWQAQRRAAMQTAVNYWRKAHEEDSEVVAYLVWAGLEPLEFRNLFPRWEVRPDVRELNLQDGKRDNSKLLLQRELALLSRTTYPLAEILQRPLPEGVDPTQLEIYLSDSDFQNLLHMSKDEFENLPAWKKTSLKKEKGLF
ncbi:supervillin-like [Euwallacea similis]|uniref:supervillin-like n=1 Tax=Euwallacea similis TaxID=1736056 RepID=UPI00344F7A62